MVFIAVDIPTLDGHVAALEMRESDSNARIVFVASRGGMSLAEDAAYSAGAVGVLQTPFSTSSVEDVWEGWMGRIPEAPGLSDLDALYPTLREAEPELPPLPPLPPLATEAVEMPVPIATAPIPSPTKPKRKIRWLVRLVLLLIIAGGAIGGAHYAGLIDLNALVEQITGV